MCPVTSDPHKVVWQREAHPMVVQALRFRNQDSQGSTKRFCSPPTEWDKISSYTKGLCKDCRQSISSVISPYFENAAELVKSIKIWGRTVARRQSAHMLPVECPRSNPCHFQVKHIRYWERPWDSGEQLPIWTDAPLVWPGIRQLHRFIK